MLITRFHRHLPLQDRVRTVLHIVDLQPHIRPRIPDRPRAPTAPPCTRRTPSCGFPRGLSRRGAEHPHRAPPNPAKWATDPAKGPPNPAVAALEPGHSIVVELAAHAVVVKLAAHAAKARPLAKMALPLPSSRLPDFRRTSLAAAGVGLEGGRTAGGALRGAARVTRGVATRGLFFLR